MTKHHVPTKAKLNSGFIASLQPGASDYLVADEEQRKLKLKVTPAGNKSFILRYRNVQGVERKLKLGDWPDLNTTVARKMAAEALLNVATGLDPAADQQSKRSGNTLSNVADTFMRDYAALHLRPKTISNYQSYMKSSALSQVMKRPIAGITRQDISDVQRQSSPTRYQSNRLVGFIRRLFNYAIDIGKVPRGQNPTDGVKLLKEAPRERLLSRAELSSIGQKVQTLRYSYPESGPAFDAITFLFMTGCRKREALDLLWKDVDFERSTIFFRKTKTDPRKQQMSEALRSFLNLLPSKSYSPYVFPGRTPERPLENVRKPWDKIRLSLGLDRLRVHDIRHTVLSDIAAESDLQTAALVGGHKSIRSTIRYVHGRSEEASRALGASAARTSKLFLSNSPLDPKEEL